jgi:D-arabinose 1-dehydrogenase-like Zn-dependent alcohol dehydrogenase
VLIKLNATGICQSDLHYMMNDWGLGPMSQHGTICAGHEGAGVIVKVGDQVKNLKVGQRAGFKPVADTCGVCDLCRTDKECYCAKAVYTGFHCDGMIHLPQKTSSRSVPKPWLLLGMLLIGYTGSYKQYVKSPERYTTLIPDGVSDYVAGPIMCSASTIYTSLKTANLRPGQWAVFPGGGGGVGIQGIQLADAMGLRPIVVDTGDDKEKLAKSLGAEHFIDFKKVENVAAEIVKIADGVGAHGVFVTAPQSYPSALSYLGSRVGGKVYGFSTLQQLSVIL